MQEGERVPYVITAVAVRVSEVEAWRADRQFGRRFERHDDVRLADAQVAVHVSEDGARELDAAEVLLVLGRREDRFKHQECPYSVIHFVLFCRRILPRRWVKSRGCVASATANARPGRTRGFSPVIDEKTSRDLQCKANTQR